LSEGGRVEVDTDYMTLFPSPDGMMHDECMVGIGGTPVHWYPTGTSRWMRSCVRVSTSVSRCPACAIIRATQNTGPRHCGITERQKNSLLPAGFDLRRAAACGHSGCYRRTDLPFVNGTERSRALHTSLKRDLSQCIRTWKTSFASALTRSGPRVAAYMTRPISIGLRLSGKS